MECKREAIASLWMDLSLPVMELEGPSETFGSHAHCIYRKETRRGRVDLLMIAQLDGVRMGLGRWLLGSLTGPVLSLIQRHGPAALLGVEGALLPAVQMGTLAFVA